MFPYSGINASEEPKTSIVVSGLQNTSDLGSLNNGGDLSSVILSGKSELTLMVWISVDDFSLHTTTGVRPFVESYPDSYPILFSSIRVQFRVRNSISGYTIVSHYDTFAENTFYHICITQSLLNGRARIYVNGVLENSAIMTYENITGTTAFQIREQEGVDIAQFNVYDRELTEAEVRSHYIYDSVLSRSGVVSFNAMTTAQKSGLSYCSSMTDNISFSGNEFNDKSGSNITMSPKPSLTGEQIYVYTDVNDIPTQPTNALPSTLPTIL